MSKRILYNISSSNLQAANISGGTISGTTITGGSLSLSGNLNVAGTLTTVNITSTNLVNTNVSAGVVVASTLLSATGNSNTIGNIFTNSGNVGIGTTSPGAKLQVDGPAGTGTNGSVVITGRDTYGHSLYIGSLSASKRLGFNHNGTVGNIFAYDYTATTTQNLCLQYPGGYVGIGTTSPTEKLHVVGNIKSTGSIDTDIQFLGQASDSATGPSFSWTGDTNTGFYRPVADTLGFVTNGAERMRITTAGNVGIGTTSPGESLDVRGNLRIGNSTQGNYITFYGTSGDEPGNYNHTYVGERIYSGTEKSELLLFKGNDVASAPGPDRIRLLASNHVFDTYTSALSGTFEGIGTSGTTRMLIDNNGNVGIGTTSPGASLHVAGSLPITSGNGICSGIDPNGNSGIQINSGTSTSGHAYIDFGYRGNDFQSRILHSNQTKSLQIQVNGSNSPTVFLTSTGNVGIGTGTNNVVSALHLSRNGSTVGNIIFEPGFTSDGGNAYFTAISVNGYHSAGEQRIGANKNRWRMYFDQRTGAESFGIDTWNGATGTTVMTIGSTGNVSVPTLWTNSVGINGAASAKQFASGYQGGGAATGNTSFGITFGYTPNVVACISQNDNTAVFGVQITSVSTTGFSYRKTFYRFTGPYGGDAVSEGFYWIAM